MNKNVACCLVLLFTLSSCSVALTKEGRMVRLFEGSPSSDCKFIGNVEGASAGGATYEGCIENATHKLMNDAASIGGTHVRVTMRNVGVMSGASLSGEAYKCGPGANMAGDSHDYSGQLRAVGSALQNMNQGMQNANQEPTRRPASQEKNKRRCTTTNGMGGLETTCEDVEF